MTRVETKIVRKPIKMTALSIAVAQVALAWGGAAYAQTAPAGDAQTTTVIVTGQRAAMQSATTRRSFYDGRLSDLGKGIPPDLMPLVSNNWSAVGYAGGPFTEAHRALLRSYVDRAHAEGFQIRFWATPDASGATRETVWAEELAAGVDVYNTDDLAGLQAWLLAHDPQEG